MFQILSVNGTITAAKQLNTSDAYAHTAIDAPNFIGTGIVATVAVAPDVAAVAVGVAIYGELEYFFDIGDKVDKAIGKKSGIG